MPQTCSASGECGMVADGCGGTLTCMENCSCDDSSFASDCPSMPCQSATGCTNGTCSYEAVVCGGESCECKTDDCSAEDLRSCGSQTCSVEMCSPQPEVVNGVMQFANQCIEYAGRSCGTCGLGAESCDAETDTFVCDEPDLAGAEPALLECNSESVRSSFVYLDTTYAGGDSDGSQSRPFATLSDATFAALGRNAIAIIIGGSPVFREPLRVENGLSIHGGFEGAPEFLRNPLLRPTWDVPSSFRYAPDGNTVTRLVGVQATDIDAGTVLSHLGIRTADLTSITGGYGADNYGVHILRSPGLRLVDLEVDAGGGGPGTYGGHGASASFDAGLMNGYGGAGGGNSACNFQYNSNSSSAPGKTCFDGTRNPGGRGGWGSLHPDFAALSGVRGGGLGGGGGSAGNAGADGARGADGANGSPGVPGGIVTSRGYWQENHSAGSGGTGGTGGGGGAGGARGARNPSNFNLCYSGSYGAGGGAGGCGGAGARGALPAGSSFGVMVVESTGMVIRGGQFRGGAGATGTRGGVLGSGAFGGPGGVGFISNGAPESVRSRNGGRGGAGGSGGHGGNAAGGSSYGIYCSVSEVDVTLSGFVPGQPGNGGTSFAGVANGNPGLALSSVGCAAAPTN